MAIQFNPDGTPITPPKVTVPGSVATPVGTAAAIQDAAQHPPAAPPPVGTGALIRDQVTGQNPNPSPTDDGTIYVTTSDNQVHNEATGPGGTGIYAPAAAPPPAASPPPAAPPPPAAFQPPPPGLFDTPGAYEEWLKANAGRLNDPTAIENLYGQGTGLNDPAINHVQDIGPGINQGNTQGFLNDLSTPGAAENLGGNLPINGSSAQGVFKAQGGQLVDPGAMETYYQQHKGDTNVAGEMEQFYKEHGGDLSNPGDMEAFYKMYGGDPMQKGYTESLYESGIGQLDPYYNYAEQRALQSAQRASAARGGFNSGYAAQQESDITGNLRGQQASKWVDLAPQADQAKIARETLGMNEANNSEQLNLQRNKQFADEANSAQTQQLNRERLGLDTAHTTESDTLNRVKGLSDIASAGDAADLGLENARITADRNAQDAANNRVKTASDISAKSEDQALQEWLANAGLAGTKDETALNNRKETSAEAQAASLASRGRLLDQAGLMKDLQEEGQNRLTGGLNATSKLSSEEAKLVDAIYGDMASQQENGPLDATWLQAEADKYGVSMDEMKAIMNMQSKVGETYLKTVGGGA